MCIALGIIDFLKFDLTRQIGWSEKPAAGCVTQSTAKANYIWLVEMRLSISHHSLYETGSKVFFLHNPKSPRCQAQETNLSFADSIE